MTIVLVWFCCRGWFFDVGVESAWRVGYLIFDIQYLMIDGLEYRFTVYNRNEIQKIRTHCISFHSQPYELHRSIMNTM